jgi:hypothetical protein
MSLWIFNILDSKCAQIFFLISFIIRLACYGFCFCIMSCIICLRVWVSKRTDKLKPKTKEGGEISRELNITVVLHFKWELWSVFSM